MSGSAYTPFFIHHHGARRPVAATKNDSVQVLYSENVFKRRANLPVPTPHCTWKVADQLIANSGFLQVVRVYALNLTNFREPVSARGPVAESVVSDVSPGDTTRYSGAAHSSTSFRNKHKYVRVETLVGGFEAGSSHLPQPDDFHSSTRSHLSGHVSDDLNNIAAEVEVNVVEEGEDDMMSQRVISEAKSSTRFRTLQQQYNKGVGMEGSRTGGGGRSTTCRPFDPQRCIDVDEMRRQLIEAYDKINQLGQSNMMCQRLKSENHSLKSALAQGEIRLHQLEGVVLERNFRLKQLLSENVRLSAKLKRMQSEFGVDAVKEAFNKEK